ncbi:MDR family MFS transporter [Lactococcus nasutitermitis]|uniref:MDR family MFS transporter n=1 Tax=Lactococcus nasutitermitis TaxID=1652957 RepID=A0ABV9JAJ9_9LACT|nr:MDR family MFS transporter [Lactococcus nasutitermitis]
MAKKEKAPKEKLPKELTRNAWVLVIGAIAPMLDSTMVNIAINKLQTDLHTSLNMIQWAITGYVLALAVAVPICGYLVNHIDGKKVLQWAIAAFGIFSFLSGLAWNIESFIAFRAIQGFSAGFITLLMTTLLMQITPRDKLGQLMAVVSTPIILGPIIGPVLGGAIVSGANWHWIFYVNIPVCIIAVFLNHFYLDSFKPFTPQSKLDWFGTILLAGGSIGLIYGMMKGSENAKHFFNAQMVTFVGLGLLLFVIYGIYNHLRHDNTVLPLRFFKSKNFTAANVGIFLAGIASNGPMLLLPLFFQNTKGFTAVEAGLMLIPQGLGMLIARPIIGKLIDRIGARPVVLVSLVISLLGTVPFIFVQTNTNLIWLAAVLFVRGIGVGGLQMPMMTDIFIGLDKKDIPSASVGQRIVQNVGSSFGSAVVSAVVTAVILSQNLTTKVSAHVTHATAVLKAHAAATHTAPTASAIANIKTNAASYGHHLLVGAQLNGYQTAFLVSCVVLVIIAIPALFLSSKKAK